MQYTLITKQGKIYTFYLEATALCYQQVYGGVVFSEKILNQKTTAI
jgi:hypothetical protein